MARASIFVPTSTTVGAPLLRALCEAAGTTNACTCEATPPDPGTKSSTTLHSPSSPTVPHSNVAFCATLEWVTTLRRELFPTTDDQRPTTDDRPLSSDDAIGNKNNPATNGEINRAGEIVRCRPLGMTNLMVRAASCPPLQKAQERRTQSSGTGKRARDKRGRAPCFCFAFFRVSERYWDVTPTISAIIAVVLPALESTGLCMEEP